MTSAVTELPDHDRCVAARRVVSDIVRHTPTLTSASVSERCGGTVALKAECLQRTGSFKLRGALTKVRATPEAAAGVVAGSAGNHAQSLAYAARACGVPCEVFMPRAASLSKLAAVEAFGARVRQEGDSVDECVALARDRAAATGATFVHPFDDHDIIAGQAGVGLEILDDAPDVRKVVVPVGGGGLASGVALAIKSRRPDVEIVGVQATACAPFADGGDAAADHGATIADGIAIKRPGAITRGVVDRLLDDVVTVSDEAIALAMGFLVERAKLVVEGAGAASLAALLDGCVAPAPAGTTVAILSGGNVDAGLLAALLGRQETLSGRRARLFARVADLPGGLAGLLTVLARHQVNVLDVAHVRDGVTLGVRETGVTVTVETRGGVHFEQTVAELRGAGYPVEPVVG